VAQAYRLNQFESPIHDRRGRLEPILALQLREYADADPGVRQQQALPLEVLQRARRRNGNVREVAISQLIVVAFFFAMRSCEYSCVQGKRMTTIVGADDIQFWEDDEIVVTADLERLRRADAVSVTFRRQKNRDNGVVVTQHRTDKTGDAEMCPVRALAALVISIWDYASVKNHGTKNVGINVLASEHDSNGLEGISSKEVLKQLRDAAAAVGEKRLGFTVDRIGTHSIRAGAAMAMFLAGVPCETIQLIGRWRSRTFMKYLRIQVTASTLGVTTKMTSVDSFFTVTISDDLDENNEEQRPQIGRNQVDTRERARTNPERQARSGRKRLTTTRTRFRGH
jgi:hypothetical protein